MSISSISKPFKTAVKYLDSNHRYINLYRPICIIKKKRKFLQVGVVCICKTDVSNKLKNVQRDRENQIWWCFKFSLRYA